MCFPKDLRQAYIDLIRQVFALSFPTQTGFSKLFESNQWYNLTGIRDTDTSQSWFSDDHRELPPKAPAQASTYLDTIHPAALSILSIRTAAKHKPRATGTGVTDTYHWTRWEESEILGCIWIITGFAVSFPSCWQFGGVFSPRSNHSWTTITLISSCSRSFHITFGLITQGGFFGFCFEMAKIWQGEKKCEGKLCNSHKNYIFSKRSQGHI